VLGPETPDFLGALALDGIDEPIGSANKEQIFHHRRGANRGLAQAEAPEHPAIPRVEGVHGAVQGRKVERLLGSDRG
jgi:hypothetical protein